MREPDHFDVAIIGAGIVGCAIAHELCRYRLDVVMLEKEAEVGFGTSKANSGIIHGGFHSDPSKLKGRLEWAGNQMWDALCDELGFGFARVGELTVALDESDLAALDQLENNAATQGVPGVERWTPQQALEAEPNLTLDIIAAVHGPRAPSPTGSISAPASPSPPSSPPPMAGESSLRRAPARQAPGRVGPPRDLSLPQARHHGHARHPDQRRHDHDRAHRRDRRRSGGRAVGRATAMPFRNTPIPDGSSPASLPSTGRSGGGCR